MKSAVTVFLFALLLGGCASSSQSSGPNVVVHLEQVSGPGDVFYFAGPVSIQYRLSIQNPTSEPLTLTRLDLQTVGPGGVLTADGGNADEPQGPGGHDRELLYAGLILLVARHLHGVCPQ